jgi:hypothetical protein
VRTNKESLLDKCIGVREKMDEGREAFFRVKVT